MQDSNIPVKFPIPFANAAGGGFIRAIPVASQIGITNGAASLTDGFPPNCFVPVAGGGSWPWGEDMNGLLKQVTQWLRWSQAGGPIAYDGAFATAIGGYPKGAVLSAATMGGLFWINTVENNLTNPDAAGAGWIPAFVSSFNGRNGAVTLTLSDVINALTYTPVQQGTGVGQLANAVKIGWSGARLKATVDVTDEGNFAMESANNTFTGTNTFTQTLATAAIAAAGAITSGGAIDGTGDITAHSGHLRASLGAYASGDPNAGVILNDFVAALAAFGYNRQPNGYLEAWGVAVMSGLSSVNFTFPITFGTVVSVQATPISGTLWNCPPSLLSLTTSSAVFDTASSADAGPMSVVIGGY